VIQPLIEGYKGLSTPDLLPDLLAGDDLARMAGEKGEDLGGLRREMDERSGFAQFSTFEVKFEGPETD
jgi:hypothetical protein